MPNRGLESSGPACDKQSPPVVMALNINEHTLKTLQISGQCFPVPGVAVAARLALSILQEAQTMKTRKEEFIAIGRDSCFIVETIIRSVQVGQNAGALIDPAMLRHIDLLAADLQYIEKHVKKAKERSGVKKIFSRQLDQFTVQHCQGRLAHAMALSGFQYLLFALLGALSYPPTPLAHSPRIQQPSAPLIERDLSSKFSPLTAAPIPATPPPRPQESQGGAERQIPQNLDRTRIVYEVPLQQMNMAPSRRTSSPTGMGFNSFPGTQNHFPAGTVIGDVNNTRDDSFNVFGTRNNIYISFSR